MRSVLEQSSFPNLQSLKLVLNSEDSLAPEEDPWNESQVHGIAPLISQISESCGPSLRLVIVKAGSPGDERLVEFLKQNIESRNRRDGSAEASRGNIENNPAVTYEVEAEYPRVDEPPHLYPRWQPSQDEGESELMHRREELNDLTEENLKVSKAKDRIFQYGLLRTPAASLVTHLIIDIKAKPDDLSLVLFHIAPNLPNLSSITIERTSALPLPQTGYPREDTLFNLSELANLAQSITTWCFDKSQTLETFKTVVGVNPSILRSISYHILIDNSTDSSSTPPPSSSLSFLAPCSSLSTLKLHLQMTSDASAGGCRWFNDAILLDKYAFADRLTSLSITAEGGKSMKADIDISVLHFASLFPSLRHLDLQFVASAFPPPPDPEPVILRLSNLQSLHLRFNGMTSALITLSRLQLPSLQVLRFNANGLYPRRDKSINQDHAKVYQFAQRVDLMQDTLKRVVLSCQDREMEDVFYDFKCAIKHQFSQTKYDVEIDTSKLQEPPYPTLRRFHDDGEVVAKRDRMELDFVENVENMMDLVEWLKNRRFALYEEDRVEEADQLWKACRELKEYKDWICD
ncbi:hypothetical protein JCM3765_005150 [Sporobolomyces pararoseus]